MQKKFCWSTKHQFLIDASIISQTFSGFHGFKSGKIYRRSRLDAKKNRRREDRNIFDPRHQSPSFSVLKTRPLELAIGSLLLLFFSKSACRFFFARIAWAKFRGIGIYRCIQFSEWIKFRREIFRSRAATGFVLEIALTMHISADDTETRQQFKYSTEKKKSSFARDQIPKSVDNRVKAIRLQKKLRKNTLISRHLFAPPPINNAYMHR